LSRFEKSAHGVWECKYQMVWCPKYRFRVMSGEIGRAVREIIRQLCEWKDLEVLEGNVRPGYIRSVLSISLRYSISEVTGFLNGKSAIKIFDLHLELKKRYCGRHFWAKGYCVSTAGLKEGVIRKYVSWRLEKDRATNQLKLWKR